MADDTITLCVISLDGGRIERLSFPSNDRPFTASGYWVASREVWAPGSTAQIRGVGAALGDRIVDVDGLLGSNWPVTEANVRAALSA